MGKLCRKKRECLNIVQSKSPPLLSYLQGPRRQPGLIFFLKEMAYISSENWLIICPLHANLELNGGQHRFSVCVIVLIRLHGDIKLDVLRLTLEYENKSAIQMFCIKIMSSPSVSRPMRIHLTFDQVTMFILKNHSTSRRNKCLTF